MWNFFFRPNYQKIPKAVEALEKYGINSQVRQQLVKFLQSSDRRELYHANPRRIGEWLQLSDRETLRVLVIAVKEGIMTLNWEVFCGMCQGVNIKPKRLNDLHTYHVCPYCHGTQMTNADENVSVTFSIDESLRRLNFSANDVEFRAQIREHYGTISGHELMTVQTFRNLFPRETIPPNESLLIRRVAILFTDLVGSTSLYSRRGDAQAYNLVHQHFGLLFQVVDKHNGVVVKTIGDAIMAAFTTPIDAFKAAIAMHDEIAKLNQQLELPSEDKLILKIGIDVGPCISVTLNERPDYFGTVVNTAARVQGTSTGNDIAFTDNLLNDLGAREIIKNYSWKESILALKGLETPISVHHLPYGMEKITLS